VTIYNRLASKLSELNRQQFVIDNRPGANGSIGIAAVARAPIDGYTILMSSNGALIGNPRIARLVKRLRVRARVLGLSDAEVARRLGLGATRYANHVNGTREPDFTTFLRICQVLKTTPNDLLGASETQTSIPSADALHHRIEIATRAMDVQTLLVATEVLEALAQRTPGRRRGAACHRAAPHPAGPPRRRIRGRR
jgi:transcriptional regulator with XRE-family HTH domain